MDIHIKKIRGRLSSTQIEVDIILDLDDLTQNATLIHSCRGVRQLGRVRRAGGERNFWTRPVVKASPAAAAKTAASAATVKVSTPTATPAPTAPAATPAGSPAAPPSSSSAVLSTEARHVC